MWLFIIPSCYRVYSVGLPEESPSLALCLFEQIFPKGQPVLKAPALRFMLELP